MEKAVNHQCGMIVVVDTSFLIAYRQAQHWTREPLKVINNSDSETIILPGVQREYNKFVHEATGNRSRAGYEQIAELLDVDCVYPYEDRLGYTLADKLGKKHDHPGDNGDSLSPVDESLVNAVKRISLKGKAMAVMSADGLILEELDEYRDTHNLEIRLFSPQNVPVKQQGIDILVSTGALVAMSQIPQDTRFKKYFAIAQNLNIGGDANYDIAFGVYVNDNNALFNPRIGGVYYKKLVFGLRDDLKYNDVSSGGCFIYAPNIYRIALVRTMNTPKPAELQLALKRQRQEANGTGKMTKRDEAILSSLTVREQDFAVIDENDIKRHNVLTFGTLQAMNKMLAKQSHP